MRIVARFCNVDLALVSRNDPGDSYCLTRRTSTSAILDISFNHSKLLFQQLPSKLSDPHHSVADPQQLFRVQPK